MAARAKTLLVLLAVLCLPAFAHVPRFSLLVQKPHQGVERFAQASHRGPGAANALNATGLSGCLCDESVRSRSTAKERDTESGLDYFGARYFGSSLGRFTSADAPFADQFASNPQSWNLYGYVRNNPLKATDPTGRATLPCGGEDEISCPASADEQFEQAKQQYNSGNYVGAGLALLGAITTKFDPTGFSPSPVAAIRITSTMGAKGAGALADAAETISKADDSVTLFRAVMPGEVADLAKTQGAFRNPKGIEGKYFSETLEGAESYASQASQAFGDGPFSFVETTIPKGAIDPSMRALPDRGIPTVVIPTGKLPLLSPARSVVPR